MNVAEYIADFLTAKGVKYVYGIPGGPSIRLIDELEKRGVRFILTSDESSAGVMAAVTGRITGIPGVCHSTFGPGATNLATGVGTALLDRNPLIAITTEMSDYYLKRTSQMNIDHQKLFTPVTKATFRITPGNITDLMDDAFTIAAGEYPGPVHLGLPSDTGGTEITKREKAGREFQKLSITNPEKEIVKALASSKRPVMAVGLTAARFGLTREVQDIALKLNLPVVITPMAKGIIDEKHPGFAGVLFHALSHNLKPLVEQCDLVIGLGYDQVEYNYESWCQGKKIVQFNTVLTDLPPESESLQYVSHPSEWFVFLEKKMKPKEENISVINNIVNYIINNIIIDNVHHDTGDSASGKIKGIPAVDALLTLRELIPENLPVTFDVGSHLHVAGRFWKTPDVDKMIMTNGWSSMGFAIPAANAIALSSKGGRAAAVLGDGCFLMRAGEVMTARRYKLNVVYFILNDNELNLIRVKQGWQGSKSEATTLCEGDFFGAGSFLGVPLYEAATEKELRKVVAKALNTEGPVIVNISVDPGQYHSVISRQ